MPTKRKPLHWSDANHPVWGIAKQVISLTALGLLLTFNYNYFDKERDSVTLALMSLLGIGMEYLPKVLSRRES